MNPVSTLTAITTGTNTDAHASITAATASARRWLNDSGIQYRQGAPELNGGVSAWYDEDERTYPYLYAEITGFFISTLCSLQDRQAQELSRCIDAAEWLLQTMRTDTGAFTCLLPLTQTRFDKKKNMTFSFDTGILMNCFANLYRATALERYRTAAGDTAQWLIDTCLLPTGELRPVYDHTEHTFPDRPDEWSLCSGSYHAKVAAALLNIFDITGEERYRDAAVRIADRALQYQTAEGRFRSFVRTDGTNLHPHFYSVEGLLTAGIYLGRQEYIDAARRGMDWALSLQKENGAIPRSYHDDRPDGTVRMDITAQALRIISCALHWHIIEKREHQKESEQLVNAVLSGQAHSEDRHSDGGFYFGQLRSGTHIPHVNTWTTLFALQGLTFYRDHLRANSVPPSIFSI